MRRHRNFGVVALLIAGLLAVSGCARPIPPKQSLEELMEMGVPESYSRLDAAGIEAVRESQVMRVDLRDLKMYKADFGLPSARLSTEVVGGPDWPDVMLVVDGPSGQLVTSTRTLEFQNKDDESFDGLLFFLQFESVEELRAELLDPKWGLNRESFETRLSSLAMGKSIRSTVVGPGYTPSGLVLDMTVRPKETAIYVTVNILLYEDLYTAEAIENIIDHGSKYPRNKPPK